jgi:hypothetical protein
MDLRRVECQLHSLAKLLVETGEQRLEKVRSGVDWRKLPA